MLNFLINLNYFRSNNYHIVEERCQFTEQILKQLVVAILQIQLEKKVESLVSQKLHTDQVLEKFLSIIS